MTPTEDRLCASARLSPAYADATGFPKLEPPALTAGVWDLPLARWAEATGATITLFDRDHRVVSGPHLAAPLTKLLSAHGFFQQGSRGWDEQRQLCAAVASTGEPHQQHVGGVLELYAIPVTVEAQHYGILTYGWTPIANGLSGISDRLAAFVGLAAGEVKLCLSSEAPAIAMANCGPLLQAMATALMAEQHRDRVEEQRGACFRLLRDASMALTTARSRDEIMEAFLRALHQLVPGAKVRVGLAERDGTLTNLPTSASCPLMQANEATKILRIGAFGVQAVMPLYARDGSLLGLLEVEGGRPLKGMPVEDLLAPLATQLAAALDAARLTAAQANSSATLDRALNELRRVSRQRDEFLATLSHELRTPMNAVLGWCQLLQTGALERMEHANALQAIERNATLQMRLVDDLLDLSQEVTGKLVIERRPLDLLDVLRHAIAAVRAAAEGKGVMLRIECHRTVLPFVGDAPRLQQVFWHLLSNAVKFTPEGGHVAVVAAASDGQIVIQVRDSGKGIRPEFLAQVFDSFSQEDGSYTRRFGGLGLGLSIVRHLVELHGGEATVESGGEGLGSTFTVTLPLHLSEPQWLGLGS